MKTLYFLVLVLLPLAVQAYPIEVEKKLNGTEIDYEVRDIGDQMGAIRLRNIGQQEADCTTVFVNGPETPRVRRAKLSPGETANLTSSFSRTVIKLRIKLTCTAD